MHIYIYIYIHMYWTQTLREMPYGPGNSTHFNTSNTIGTPNPPTNIVPTNIAQVKLSRGIPRKSLWAWEFHPFQLTLCSSQTL